MYDARYRQIGAKIRYYRTIKDINQAEFAQTVGITSQYLSKIERGTAKPSTDLLSQITDALGIDITVIMKCDLGV